MINLEILDVKNDQKYCAALALHDVSQSRTMFVMHRVIPQKGHMINEKKVFQSREELLGAFPDYSPGLEWSATNSSLGYDGSFRGVYDHARREFQSRNRTVG